MFTSEDIFLYGFVLFIKMDYFSSFLFPVTFIVVLYYILRKRTGIGKDIPGPKGWPLIGSLLEVSPENIHEKGYQYAKEYGAIVKITLAGRNVILLNTLEMINKAFCEEDAKRFLNDRPKTYLGDNIFKGTGIAMYKDGSPGSLHGHLRKIFTKGLHVYGDGIKEFEDNVISEIGHMIESVEDLPDKEFEVVHTIELSLANLLSILLTGEQLADQEQGRRWMVDFNEGVDFLASPKADFLQSYMPWVRHFPGPHREHYQRLVKASNNLLEIFFMQMKKTYKPGHVRGFSDFLLEEQRRTAGGKDVFTDVLAESIVTEFIAAGFTTTLASLSAIILYLLRYPEYQDKIYKEICEVVGERLPRLEDKSKCPVTKAVIMEAMRLAPVALLGAPHTTNQDVNCGGYHVPKGSVVLPNLWFLLHDERIWGDPWVFRPERFLDDSGELLPRSHVYRKSWIPFGVGRRQCIGEQFARSRIFLYTSSIFQRWKLVPSRDKNTSCDPRSDQFRARFLLHANPFYCRAERRR